MREQLTALGCRIRDLRKQRNMTLQELGEKTHLTAGLLSKIENFRTVPSLPVLAEIARALGIALSELFEGIAAAERKEWILIHPEEQKDLEREENHGLRYRMIFETPLDTANLQVMLVTEGDGKQQERVITEADQLLYILSGEFYYCIGEEKVLLRAGDLLFFDGTLAHGPAYEPGTHFSLLAFYFLHTGKDPNESWRSIR